MNLQLRKPHTESGTLESVVVVVDVRRNFTVLIQRCISG